MEIEDASIGVIAVLPLACRHANILEVCRYHRHGGGGTLGARSTRGALLCSPAGGLNRGTNGSNARKREDMHSEFFLGKADRIANLAESALGMSTCCLRASLDMLLRSY